MTGRIIRRIEPELGGHSRLPLLGRIKIGAKEISKKTGKEYPTSLDYFRADGKYAELFHRVYGDRPQKIQIVFFSNRLEDVCSESYIVRDDAGRLLAEGDGENWKCWSAKTNQFVYGQFELAEIQRRLGKPHVSLTLRFILPKVPGVFGMWQFTTKGGASSIPAIRDTVDQVMEMAGVITNIPFDLVVEKVKSNKPGASSVFPVVTLIPNISQENLDILADYVRQGTKLRGLLTEDRIRTLAVAVEAPALEAATLPALPPVEAPQAPVAQADPEPDPEPEADDTTETDDDLVLS